MATLAINTKSNQPQREDNELSKLSVGNITKIVVISNEGNSLKYYIILMDYRIMVVFVSCFKIYNLS